MVDIVSLVPGTCIGGRYIVGSLLSSGGFGSVYRGINTSEGNRPCAIKETYDVTPAARRQALTEVAVLFTFNNPHLPQVYDAFEEPGRFYLVMQLIEGQNLLELSKVRGRPCSEEEALRWLLPVIDVLQELHSRNPAVMHRDIKPGNIILTPDERAVLVDFGLTRLYDPTRNSQTLVRAVTEGFSPIEQYIGKTSPQSDIYSMAATMYFLLTQTVPPVALERSFHDTLVAPRLLNARISPNIEVALLKALAVNADQRFDSMHAFASALRQPAYAAYAYADAAFAGAQTERIEIPPPPPTLPPPPTSFAPMYAPAPAYGMQSRQQPERSQNGVHAQPLPFSPVPQGKVTRPPRGRVTSTPVYPMLPTRPNVAPPQPAPRTQNYKALPGAYNQGCLWGMLQGICAALIVLNMRNSSSIYMAIAEGFFFYFVAGLLTARKGGSSLRGIWAGFWAGIFSTIVFWSAILVGVVVEVARRIQLNGIATGQQGQQLNPFTNFGQALQLVVPALANQQNMQQRGGSIIVYLVAGLLIAMLLGWIGGAVGSIWARRRGARYRA
ncbi:MAG TPA: protein kinase [Ktedonobacteraceae bacterium]|nr:protein kinase [Ktedonobacteraceae bacterium]